MLLPMDYERFQSYLFNNGIKRTVLTVAAGVPSLAIEQGRDTITVSGETPQITAPEGVDTTIVSALLASYSDA